MSAASRYHPAAVLLPTYSRATTSKLPNRILSSQLPYLLELFQAEFSHTCPATLIGVIANYRRVAVDFDQSHFVLDFGSNNAGEGIVGTFHVGYRNLLINSTMNRVAFDVEARARCFSTSFILWSNEKPAVIPVDRN